ncbi:MAG TPA: SAM-dependent methyltransferase [Gemmatimonadaceae bacterium]|nr:SAM-dependent methyltransferase [Gemmatimonadaceae bacterium]
MALIRNISDTARWAAVFRARETERSDALFRDPLARKLAGDRGEQIAASMKMHEKNAWSWVMRTYLFDQYIARGLASGVDTILNLAAGLDARPYRMDVPPTLRWIEVDLPELLAYKEEVLAGEKSRCAVERIALDLSDVAKRRALFAQIGVGARKVMVLSEGLLLYLSAEDVGTLASDLARQPSFQYWAFDIVSPGLLEMLRRQGGGAELAQAGAPFKFASPEGPGFFARYGWRPADVQSTFKAAGRAGRLPWSLRIFSFFPESNGVQGKRPWSGICLMERA